MEGSHRRRWNIRNWTQRWLNKKFWKIQLLNIFPWLVWFPKYYLSGLKKGDSSKPGPSDKAQDKWYHVLKDDVVAGLSVGFLSVPQGMAYSSLVGIHPVYGK
jgi:MFS superfamily sulfate permease-like transporter